ncbi:RNA-directed DNA polymerase, eukaryota [Tanacetum coccineum]|uniref:RNA-directed DNA polymerase, eukaryota n=1 Tax=Tanacetum coccineum TaxID=301880 RepID=A0ABQ4X2Q0_9ASTR
MARVALACGPITARDLTFVGTSGNDPSLFFSKTVPCVVASRASSWLAVVHTSFGPRVPYIYLVGLPPKNPSLISISKLFETPLSTTDSYTSPAFIAFSECSLSESPQSRSNPAVWDCGIDKSSGPDGFTLGFYRRFWSIIENDVFEAVKYFCNNGAIPNGCNFSFIALIPKIPYANLVKDFRPISLIGSMYKIIAKILANRLVGVLGDIVNEVQSAFIAERQILVRPFILNEVLQWCKLKKKQSLIFNVDFEKAFDSICWDFLGDILKKLVLVINGATGFKAVLDRREMDMVFGRFGDFSVASTRKAIDDKRLLVVNCKTRWIKSVPIKACNDYGVVVDAFIPYKKSKAGKRFAFVRFIKVDNIDHLVTNLCTIWIGRFHLHANVARFHRERKPSSPSHLSNANKRNSPGSFVSILKSGKKNNVMSDQVLPSLILDDSCISNRNFSLSLMGKVKDITVMPNLCFILEKEGFHNLSLTYLGGLWVFIEMVSTSAKEKLINQTGAGLWFSSLKPACNSFVSDERIVWISLEGLPLKVWTRNTFAKVASKWGDLSSDDEEDAEEDGSLSGDKVTSDNDVERVSESSFKKIVFTPSPIYGSTLNKRKDSGDDLKYPPGFTPSVINMEEVNEKGKRDTSNKVNEHVNSTSNKLEVSVLKGKLSSNNSVCSKRVHTSGSILQLIDGLVKVGQTMSYNMEGCMRNIEVIIGPQGECNVVK